MAERKKLSKVLQTLFYDIENEDGVIETYTLKELDGVGRDKFLNKNKNRLRYGPDGKALGVKDFTGSMSDLLEMCLYNGAGNLVEAKEIQSLPSSTQTELFNDAMKLSKLDAASQEEGKEKNSQ